MQEWRSEKAWRWAIERINGVLKDLVERGRKDSATLLVGNRSRNGATITPFARAPA